MDETLKLTEFDQQVGNSRLQMLKAAIPYLSPERQGLLALLTKYLELESTRHLYETAPDSVRICEKKEVPPGPFGILDVIRPYGSREDQSRIDFAKNLMHAMSLYRKWEEGNAEEPEDRKEDTLEAQAWNTDPTLKGMDPRKLSFLMEMTREAGKQSQDTLLPFLMTMMSQSREQGLNFSDAEMNLILQVLRQRMSPAEQGRMDMILKMSQMMNAGGGSHPPENGG